MTQPHGYAFFHRIRIHERVGVCALCHFLGVESGLSVDRLDGSRLGWTTSTGTIGRRDDEFLKRNRWQDVRKSATTNHTRSGFSRDNIFSIHRNSPARHLDLAPTSGT